MAKYNALEHIEQREVKKLKKRTELKPKRKKVYNLCTWYPHDCNAVGCELTNEPCRDFKED